MPSSASLFIESLYILILRYLQLVAAAFTVSFVSAAGAQQGQYLIQPGDVLAASVWQEADLKRELLIVRPDGWFTFPLAGEILAQGRTVTKVTEDLKDKISAYIPDPAVTVEVANVSGNQFYVLGKVARPGVFPMSRPTDIVQALAIAGGTTTFASLGNIIVLRRENRVLTAIEFDYADVEKGRNLDQNIELRYPL